MLRFYCLEESIADSALDVARNLGNTSRLGSFPRDDLESIRPEAEATTEPDAFEFMMSKLKMFPPE